MGKNILTKESVIEASQIFITGKQLEKNMAIDRMFNERPALIELVQYLDKAIQNELTKEVVIQLMAIFYKSFSLQGIKLRKINFEEFLSSLSGVLKSSVTFMIRSTNSTKLLSRHLWIIIVRRRF